MLRVPKDVLIYHVFIHLDGRDLSRLRILCKFFKDSIDSNERLKNRIDKHHVHINNPCEFMDLIGNPTFGGWPDYVKTLRQEGTRIFINGKNGQVIEFNDFYYHSHTIEFPSGVEGYLFVTYEPLYDRERFQLPLGLGTIHRGASIVLFH